MRRRFARRLLFSGFAWSRFGLLGWALACSTFAIEPVAASSTGVQEQTSPAIMVVLHDPSSGERDESTDQLIDVIRGAADYLEDGELGALQGDESSPEDEKSLPFFRQVRPAGDTVFMRHPDWRPKVSDEVRRQFQAIALARDLDFKERKLRDLAASPEHFVRYRALLELARIGLRRSKTDVAAVRAALTAALAAVHQASPGRCWKADALFLLGFLMARDGRTEAALSHVNAALDCDPAFLNARWLRIRLHLQRLAQAHQYGLGRRCRRLVADILRDINAYVVLSGNRLHFLRLADDLQSVPLAGAEIGALVSGYAALLGGDRRRAERNFSLTLDAVKSGSPCLSRMSGELQQLVDLAKSQGQ